MSNNFAGFVNEEQIFKNDDEKVMDEVILGMPGPWADDKFEAADHYTTKIGGLPDWPIPDSTIRSDLLLCGACGSNLCLVVQVYAPVLDKTLKTEERVIYVFGCVMPKCGSSPACWRALRVQKSLSDEKSNINCHEVIPPTASPLSASDWRDNLWTFDSREYEEGDDDDIDLEDLGRALSEAASLASHSNKQNNNCHPEAIVEPMPMSKTTRPINDKIPVLPCFYLYMQKEAFSRESTVICSSCTSLSIKDYQNDLDDRAPEETWEEEGYEYDRALNADRTYLKFKKRMDAYPEQCFRYSYGGTPLPATGGAVDSGKCSYCGALMHYEMQLMPPLLHFLEEALDCEEYSLENWNWMTLVVYTCSMGCSHSNLEDSGTEGWTVAEQVIMVQYE